MIEHFWDAERITRDAESGMYVVWPREPRDEHVAASIGATLANEIRQPTLIWRNDMEET